MRQLEVFFDYICPYCWIGHQHLLSLLAQFPDLSVIWRPCESHPRPDHYGPHSDLCIQGMYYARDHGVNLLTYHQAVYDAVFADRVNVEQPKALAAALSDLLDAKDLLDALENQRYLDALRESNAYAFEKCGVWVVPAYRMEGRSLDVIEDVGITKAQLATFLK